MKNSIESQVIVSPPSPAAALPVDSGSSHAPSTGPQSGPSDEALIAQMKMIWDDLHGMREQSWKPIGAYSIVLAFVGFSLQGAFRPVSDVHGASASIGALVLSVASGFVLALLSWHGMKIAIHHNGRMQTKLAYLAQTIESGLKLRPPTAGSAGPGRESHGSVGDRIVRMYACLFGLALALMAAAAVSAFLHISRRI